MSNVVPFIRVHRWPKASVQDINRDDEIQVAIEQANALIETLKNVHSYRNATDAEQEQAFFAYNHAKATLSEIKRLEYL